MKYLLGALTLFIAPHISAAENLFNWHQIQAEKHTSNSGIGVQYKQGDKFSLNTNILASFDVGDSFTVNLNDDQSYPASIIKIKHKAHTKHIIAHIQQQDRKLPIVITMGKNQFFMRIVAPETTWVAQGKKQSGWLIEEKLKHHASLTNDVKIPHKEVGTKHNKITAPKQKHFATPLINSNSSLPAKAKSTAVNNANVDVLFVYAIPQSFIDSEYNGDVLTRIEHLIEVTNQIYIDSNVNMQITAADIISVEYPTDLDSDAALDDITFKEHEAFTDIDNIRFEKGADMVALLRPFVDGDSACGLAWGNATIANSTNYMFSHTSIDCGDYVLAHELGHNMGLAHSRAQGDTGYTFPYALGYRIQDVNNGFSSVMAYSVNNAGKIYKFSNPDILCTELPCGIDRNDPVNGADASYALNQVNIELENLFQAEPNLILANEALVNITDNNLKQCLASTINNGNIKYAGQVTDLYCSYKNVDLLNGIEHFPNIVSLTLDSNNISNLTPLSGLTKLSYLSLSDNNINDISALSQTSQLTNVYLDFNSIVDISALSGNHKIKQLWINDNNIESLSPLAEMTELYYLYANSNSIQSIDVLENLTALEYLYLTSNNISDISALADLSFLRFLYLGYNDVIDVTPLKNLDKLEILALYHNEITDISSLLSLFSLETLEIDNNDIVTIPFGEQMPNLNVLLMNNNALQSIENISQMPFLERLNLKDNNINDISALHTLTNLEDLTLSNNPLVNTTSLSELTQLTKLLLDNTQINSLAFVNNLYKLSTLNIANTLVNDISALQYALALNDLDISNTNVTDVTALFELHNQWQTINISGSTSIKCWQQNYIEHYFNINNLFKASSCNPASDLQDFDDDGVNNDTELANDTNPIYHNTQPGIVHFQLTHLNLEENSEINVFKVVRSQGGSGEISVDLKANAETATAGSDYVELSQTLTFADNEFFKILYLSSVRDNDFDQGKTFNLTLENISTGSIGTPNKIDVTIQDTDQANISWLTQSLEVSESEGSFTVTIQRPNQAPNEASVTVGSIDASAENDVHYQFEEKVIDFAQGEYTKDITVNIINNNDYSGDRVFYLTLSNANGAVINDEDKNLSITILEDEQPAVGNVAFTTANTSVNEGTNEISLIVSRSDGADGELSVNYQTNDVSASSGSDYELTEGTITFEDGELQKTLTVNITNDTIDESDETFTVTLSANDLSLIGEISTITVTIVDNDSTTPPPTTGGGSSSSSGGGAIWYLFSLLIISTMVKRRY
ncbi:Calx-beta domain-containing protein [Thalassotalea sp. 1_MG-2023]|uniref:Calx-beta domain-containing protein n=1 Tax=Thalassotalea sp. 1_MG-2023 TaxID=3062680 RepID=UPI0026E265E7|nr:Calx-beta domain-containing protein [Thalassotalea sp. 1_MG-2023]MDO6428469.1 Calx-beta domain-containing protein [Thalassotalea sp. 1_MG-2023]